MLFFFALALPAGVLIWQAYSQLKWEAFHQHREVARELAQRIDHSFVQLVNEEEARSFTDYAFLIVAGDPATGFVQRSPLSAYPIETVIPGLIGYFQVDSDGIFSSPLLPEPGTDPANYGIAGDELNRRHALVERLHEILSRNRLVHAGESAASGFRASATGARQRRDQQPHRPAAGADKDVAGHRLEITASAPVTEAEEQPVPQTAGASTAPPAEQDMVSGQAFFDRLNQPSAGREKKQQETASALGRVADLKLDYSLQAGSADEIQHAIAPESALLAKKRGARKESNVSPQPRAASPHERPEGAAGIAEAIRISTFESELDPFEFSLLDSGHFVLFRKVWRDGRRYIQGALIEQQPFLRGVIEAAFGGTALSRMSDLIVAYRGNVFSAFTGQASRRYLSSADELTGAVLYQTRLLAPLSDLELIFNITRLPSGPGATVIGWVAATLMIVLGGGFYLMYRLGTRQIELARQQQDFVSAVSHELKTPLTSIRMYSEMLREGWAPDEKKKTYYDFIHDESERLSRLVNNVLQLARMTRNDTQLDLKPTTVAELTDHIRLKLASQIERAGFDWHLNCEDDTGRVVVDVDTDYFTQIVINLIDNAIKFSATAQEKIIDISWRRSGHDAVQFSVRDHGPGVPRDRMTKIFKLFYRLENELTRETVGTGIGLALVHQLALAMNATVDVVNRDPGAEFKLTFAVPTSGKPPAP